MTQWDTPRDGDGHVWGTQPGEQIGGGTLSDLRDGGCPSHMIYPDGVCVSQDDRQRRAAEFLPVPSDCESGVLIVNPTLHCETPREKTADTLREAIERAQQQRSMTTPWPGDAARRAAEG